MAFSEKALAETWYGLFHFMAHKAVEEKLKSSTNEIESNRSVTGELADLIAMKKNGDISQDEFDFLKAKIIN